MKIRVKIKLSGNSEASHSGNTESRNVTKQIINNKKTKQTVETTKSVVGWLEKI